MAIRAPTVVLLIASIGGAGRLAVHLRLLRRRGRAEAQRQRVAARRERAGEVDLRRVHGGEGVEDAAGRLVKEDGVDAVLGPRDVERPERAPPNVIVRAKNATARKLSAHGVCQDAVVEYRAREQRVYVPGRVEARGQVNAFRRQAKGSMPPAANPLRGRVRTWPRRGWPPPACNSPPPTCRSQRQTPGPPAIAAT